MKTTIKIVAAVLLIVAGWFASNLFKKHADNNKNPIAEIKKREIQTEALEIKRQVDKNGLQHTIYKMVKEIDHSAVDAVKSDLLDTIQALGIARNRLKQITLVATNLSISNQKLEKRIEELGTTYSHKDSHFNLSVNIPKDPLIQATFDAVYDADLITSQHTKSRWLLFDDQLIDIYSNDKRFTIKGVKTLTIKPEPAKFAASVDFVTDYNKFIGVRAGAEARLRMGRFVVKTGYQYYPNFKEWNFDYGLRYRIIGQD